jgi:Mrp family chromosome partitioning ATPase
VSTYNEAVPPGSVSVRDQLAVLARRWRLIVALVIVGGLASGLYISTKSTTYSSSAQVQVKPVTTSQFAAQNTPLFNSVSMPTEQRLASSLGVADRAADLLGGGITGAQAESHLTVTVPASTLILQFGYSAATPHAAQAGANAFARAYLASRRATNQAAVAATRKGLQAKNTNLLKRESGIEARLASTNDQALRAALQGQISSLNQQLSPISSALASLSQIDPTAATLAETANLPTAPSGTSHSILLAAGLMAGLVLGLILAFLREAADDRLRGPNDLAALIGAPVLARIPYVRSSRSWRRHEDTVDGPAHPKAAEAYRVLANRLVVAASKQDLSSVLVASPSKGEGRSSVAANVAASFVDLGCRVWLVSADLLPPQVHRLFSPEDASAVVSVEALPEVATRRTAQELMVAVADPHDSATHGHLTLSTSGGRQRREGRLLNPIAMANQVRQNQHNVDITIIDGPALLEFADAVPLLPVVDGVIVVADAGSTKRSELEELSALLGDTGARVLGGVLNRDSSWVVSRRARRSRQRLERHRPPTRPEPSTPSPAAGSATDDARASAAQTSRPTFDPVDDSLASNGGAPTSTRAPEFDSTSGFHRSSPVDGGVGWPTTAPTSSPPSAGVPGGYPGD